MFKKENSENQSKIDMLFPSTQRELKAGHLRHKGCKLLKNQQFIPLLTAIEMTCHLMSHTIG